jgi:hypothetical protein
MRAEGVVAAARIREDLAMDNREYVHTESCARSEILLCLTLALHTRIRQQQRGSSMELVLRDIWSRRSGLNGRPAVYETAALPTELRRLSRETSQFTRDFSQPQGVFCPTTDDRNQQAPDFNTLACLTNRHDHGRYLNLATGCSLTMAPWPGPGRQRGSCSFPYCSRAILDTCPLV